MPAGNPIQQVVLGQWGITVLSGGDDGPEEALIRFLEELQDKVGCSRSQQAVPR
jgi:hypothetical protein